MLTMSESTKIDDMYMENLEEWVLEEEKVVTYKYLSKNLKVHVNVAKQMLFNFVQGQKNKLGVVYLVSGLVKCDHGDDSADIGTQQKVVLVKEADLEKVKSKFSEVLSQHIYSVQKTSESVNVTSLFGADKQEPGQDVTAGASLASIKHKAAVPREAIIRAPAVVKQDIKTEPIAKKEEKKDTAKKVTGIEASFSKTVVKKPSPVKTETTKPVTKDKGKSNIANMFAKQSTKPKPSKTATATEEKENIVNQKIEESKENKVEKKEKKEITRFGKIKEETNTKSKSKSDSQKRKRIQVMSDSEDDDDKDEQEEEEDKPIEEPEAPPVTKLIESDEEDIPATPVQKTAKAGRKRVKKQVDKTFMDDKGYMVTKKVYESASETDDESSEPSKAPTPKKQEKVEPPASKKAKIAGPGSGGKGQTGIMSFFKKK